MMGLTGPRAVNRSALLSVPRDSPPRDRRDLAGPFMRPCCQLTSGLLHNRQKVQEGEAHQP